MTLSPADYTVLNDAIADLRAWDEAQRTSDAGARVNPMVARALDVLEQLANGDEADVRNVFTLSAAVVADVIGFLEFTEQTADRSAVSTRRAARDLLVVLRRAHATALPAPEPSSEDAPLAGRRGGDGRA